MITGGQQYAGECSLTELFPEGKNTL